jgi:hypothetical protein
MTKLQRERIERDLRIIAALQSFPLRTFKQIAAQEECSEWVIQQVVRLNPHLRRTRGPKPKQAN